MRQLTAKGILRMLPFMLVTVGGCGGQQSVAKDIETRSDLVRSVPQHGPVLGSSSAANTLVVFARPEDTRALRFVRETLPQLVVGPVREGRLKVLFRTTRDGTAGDPALAELLQAAGLQDHFWEALISTAFRFGGAVDDLLVRELANDVNSLDGARLLRDIRAPRVAAAVRRASVLAEQSGITRFGFVLITPAGATVLPPAVDRVASVVSGTAR